MEPIAFPEVNKVLTLPGAEEGKRGDLPVFTDGVICISLWKMTWRERFHILFFGKLWLYIWSGKTQPPVGFVIEQTIFIDDQKEES